MEYCEGGVSETIDLDKLIQKYKNDNKVFSEKEAMKFCVQMAQALQYIHSNKIIHRDLKPANIFIKGEQYKLGDFGIVKVGELAETIHSFFLNQFYYYRKFNFNFNNLKQPYNAKTNVWDLGCILYELCTL